MIIKKSKVFILICFIFLFLLAFTVMLGIGFTKEEVKYVYSYQPVVELTEEDLPLPKPSTITTQQDKIRLDLEKISANKFYIVYSVIYGDQSHTAYHLFLTNLNRKKLEPDDVGEITLKTGNGEVIQQIAQPTITGFPKDQPLGWKIKILAKFPYKAHRKSHSLELKYKQKKFVLKDILY